MLVKPQRRHYQWIYDPDKHVLLLLPLWQDINIAAKNVLFNIFKSLDLEVYLPLFNDESTTLQRYICLADDQTFIELIHQLQPKWVAAFGNFKLNHPTVHQFPHPNLWQQNWQLKKRIWLACHDLKHKVL
jgi:hypothetical protein